MELVIFFSTGLEIPLALGDFARVGCKEKKSNRSPHMKGNTCNIKKREKKKVRIIKKSGNEFGNEYSMQMD